jgi:thioredoxin-like negative regulator of GroEL
MPLGFITPAVVDPGVYSLRLGVVDASGRRGSVVREVNAWKLSGEEFAVADLVIGPVPDAGNPLLPAVEPHVSDSLAGLIELYSTNPALFDRTTVAFEVADAEEAPALMTARGEMSPDAAQPGTRSVQALLNPRALPAGRYVMRARITRDGQPVGLLVRPFVLTPPAAAALPDNPPQLAIPRFDRGAVMAAPVLGEILAGLERQTPSLREATAAARDGRFGAAALEALTAGAQEAAAFFKGLEWYEKGDINQAANQFNIAAGPRRTFFPAAFYLGAAFAAAGRDRDAAGVLQMSFGSEPRPSMAYALFADARLRDGQPQSVVDVLGPAWSRTPADDEIGQRLAVAYVLTGRHAEALPVLEGYISRHPDDQVALFAAIIAQYEAATRAGVSLSDAENARLTRWARAYSGPQRALVDKYVETLRAR